MSFVPSFGDCTHLPHQESTKTFPLVWYLLLVQKEKCSLIYGIYSGVSISTDDRQNASATLLREVGSLLEAGNKVLN